MDAPCSCKRCGKQIVQSCSSLEDDGMHVGELDAEVEGILDVFRKTDKNSSETEIDWSSIITLVWFQMYLNKVAAKANEVQQVLKDNNAKTDFMKNMINRTGFFNLKNSEERIKALNSEITKFQDILTKTLKSIEPKSSSEQYQKLNVLMKEIENDLTNKEHGQQKDAPNWNKEQNVKEKEKETDTKEGPKGKGGAGDTPQSEGEDE